MGAIQEAFSKILNNHAALQERKKKANEILNTVCQEFKNSPSFKASNPTVFVLGH